MRHLEGYLAADVVDLTADVLDRIAAIVPAAVTINVGDNTCGLGTPALSVVERRR
jgi:hypothetical protein